MSFFYHLSFLLFQGDYLGLYFVNTFLLGFTAVFILWTLEILGYKNSVVPSISAILIVLNGADAAISFVPMLVVRQSIFFAALAIFLIIKYQENGRVRFLLFASIAEFCSLWSYEATFPVLLYIGLILTYKNKSKMLLWFVPLVIFVLQVIYRYIWSGEDSYQKSRISIDGLDILAQKFFKLVFENFYFFDWPFKWYEKYFQDCIGSFILDIKTPVLLLFFITLFVTYHICKKIKYNFYNKNFFLLNIFVILFLSYLPFIFLNNLENSGINYLTYTFRAHFLASIPASILITLFLLRVSEKYGKVAFSIPFFSIIFMGGISGIFAQFENLKIAEQSKYIQRSIVQVVPYIPENSLLVLINLPDHGLESFCQASKFDPYGDSMWFNSALKVLYPTTKLVGIYYADNNSDLSKKSIIFKAKESSFSLISSPVTVDFNSANLEQVLIFDYQKIGTDEFLLKSINSSTIPGLDNFIKYSPFIHNGSETNYSPIFYKNIEKTLGN